MVMFIVLLVLIVIFVLIGILVFKILFTRREDSRSEYYDIGGIRTDIDDALGIQEEMARHGYKLTIKKVVNGKVVSKIKYGSRNKVNSIS